MIESGRVLLAVCNVSARESWRGALFLSVGGQRDYF